MRNPEKIVKTKYPNANIERDGAMYFIYAILKGVKKDLGAGFTKNAAWLSAAITASK